MVKRSVRIGLEIVSALVGLAVIVVGIAVWRLSTGPVEVEFLTPYVEQALGHREEGVQVDVERTVLTWGGWPDTVDLRARRVTVRQADGTRFLSLPEVSVRFSFRALLEGVIAATDVEVIGARLVVVRQDDGRFTLAGAAGLGPQVEEGETADAEPENGSAVAAALPKAFAEVMAAPDPTRPLSYLSAIRLSEGVLVIRDNLLDNTWRARNVVLSLERAQRGLDGYVTLNVQLPGSTAFASADLLYDAAAGRLEIDTHVLQLWPSDLAAASPRLEELSGMQFPVTGRITALVSAEGRVERLAFDIEAGDGSVSLPGWLPEAVPLSTASLEGELSDLGEERLVVREARMVFDPPEAPGATVSARMTGHREETGLAMTVDAALTNFRMEALPLFWPSGVAEGGRGWVLENIPRGEVRELALTSRVSLPGGDLSQPRLEDFTGNIAFTGTEVHYLRPMPPVTEVSGTATFDEKGLYLRPAGGVLGDLTLGEGQIDITGLEGDDHRIAIEFGVEGPLSDALALLNHPRVDLISQLGLSANGMAGEASVSASFTFPLVASLGFDDVDVGANASLTDVVAPEVMLGLDLTDGQLTVDVDKEGLRIFGPGRIADIPLTFDWREKFAGEGPTRTIEARLPELGEYGREVLGVTMAPYLTGPIALDIDYTTDPGGSGEVGMQADFTDAELQLPFMNWRKESGQSATGRGTVELEKGNIVHIGDLRVEGERFVSEGDVYFLPNGEPHRLSLSRFMAGESDLRDVELKRREGGLHLAIGAGRLDARPFLQELQTGDVAEDAREDEAAPPLLVEAPSLDPVILADDRRLRNVALRLERKARGWVLISLEGDVPGELRRAPRSKTPEDENENSSSTKASPPPVPINFYFGPDGSGGEALSADSEDFGATLRAFDLLDTIEGGEFQLRGGRSADAMAEPLEASLHVSEFKMVEAPVMARILSIASLTGTRDLLRGEGIRFTEALGDLRIKDGKISSELLRAYGPALGLTAKGEVDFTEDAIDVGGTVVPAYSVNRILGEIPLLGRVLTGGEGEGVVAFTYSVSGPVTEPEVSVNPLSVLTPGFLRGVFNLFEGGSAPEEGEISAYPMPEQTR